MALKLFSNSKTLSLNDMRSPDPLRDVTVHDNTEAAGYKADTEVEPVAPGSSAMHIFSTDTKLCRQVDGKVYGKPK